MIEQFIFTLNFSLIQMLSNRYDVDANLIASIVSVESSGQPCAMRYEPHFRWIVNPDFYSQLNAITVQTEVVSQKTSWGLMQVMGAVARELGHDSHLSELCKPEIGLKYGIKKIVELQNRYDKIEDVISSYNQGSPRKTTDKKRYRNQIYVNKVISRYNYLNGVK